MKIDPFYDINQNEKGFDIHHAKTIESLGQTILITDPATSLESIEIKNNLFYGFGDTRRPDSKAKGYQRCQIKLL